MRIFPSGASRTCSTMLSAPTPPALKVVSTRESAARAVRAESNPICRNLRMLLAVDILTDFDAVQASVSRAWIRENNGATGARYARERSPTRARGTRFVLEHIGVIEAAVNGAFEAA